MKKTTATAGGAGAIGAATTLYNQSWEFWMDALPIVTMCGMAAIFVLGVAIVILWGRVRALEDKR